MNGKALAAILTVVGIITAIIGGGQTQPELSQFQTWKSKFNMKFDSLFEESYREKIFLENIAKIA